MIFAIAVMFHGKHGNKGYDSADFFCETCPPTASDKVKKVIKGYGLCDMYTNDRSVGPHSFRAMLLLRKAISFLVSFRPIVFVLDVIDALK